MAKPRVFVSSTYYDLKHIRASLELFIGGMGFEAVLSESGGVPYLPDIPLDDSCYREVGNTDILVLVIGGRYGSRTSEKKPPNQDRLTVYESITRREYSTAQKMKIPVYVLVESAVYAEYRTFQMNRGNKRVKYAHVDSVNVFRFIEDILSEHRGNPLQAFERFSEIENWLREQWAGLFRDLLKDQSERKQLSTLQNDISTIREVGHTLRKYLESMMEREGETYASILDAEKERLDRFEILDRVRLLPMWRYLVSKLSGGVSEEQLFHVFRQSRSAADLRHRCEAVGFSLEGLFGRLIDSDEVVKDLAEVKQTVGGPSDAPWADVPTDE